MIRLWYTLTLLVGLLWLSAGLLPAGQAPTGKDADILARLRAVDEEIARGWSATLFVTRNGWRSGDSHARYRVTADATRAAIWGDQFTYLTLPPFVPNSPFQKGTSLNSRPVQDYMLKDLHTQLNANYTEWEALTTTASGEIIEQARGGATLVLYPMDIDSFAMDEGEILHVAGRGYGRYLKRVLEQKRSKDGLLHLRAEGWLGPEEHGEWRLTVEPRDPVSTLRRVSHSREGGVSLSHLQVIWEIRSRLRRAGDWSILAKTRRIPSGSKWSSLSSAWLSSRRCIVRCASESSILSREPRYLTLVGSIGY
jgi:hypothetical protein